MGCRSPKPGHRPETSFVLMMADHIFDPNILVRLASQALGPDEIILGVDFNVENHTLVDMDDVTKVFVERGKITDIGKKIKSFNALTPAFFSAPAISAPGRKPGEGRLHSIGRSQGARGRRQGKVMNIIGGCWVDVDDERPWKKRNTSWPRGPIFGRDCPFPPGSHKDRSGRQGNSGSRSENAD